MNEKLQNIYYSVTAQFFKFLREKTKFNGKVTFECSFNSLEEVKSKFHISDNEFYNENDILFSEDMVSVENGLKIRCISETGKATTWQRTGVYHWKTGCLKTWIKNGGFTQSGGTWVVEAIFPRTWAALWLLHPDYFVQSIGKNHIIPEIDFAECNNKRIDNVAHYGYDKDRYSNKGKINHVHKADGKLHEYAVEILADGYNFYLDGYLTTKYRSNDPEFVSNEPKYLVINNAVAEGAYVESEFIIKSVKVYK
jgi:hypothetical protein